MNFGTYSNTILDFKKNCSGIVLNIHGGKTIALFLKDVELVGTRALQTLQEMINFYIAYGGNT